MAAAKKTPAAVKSTPKKPNGNVQQNTEDKVLRSLISRYTKLRNWDMVEDLLHIQGQVWEDRERGII